MAIVLTIRVKSMKFPQLLKKCAAFSVVAFVAAFAHAEDAVLTETTQQPAAEAVAQTVAPAVQHAAKMAGEFGPDYGQLGMVMAKSPVLERLSGFHDVLLVLITVVTVLVLALMVWVCIRYREKRNPVPSTTSHNTLIEIVWTLVPVLILVVLAIPSLRLLYFMDKSQIEGQADLTLKVVGYQWYWNYEYPDYGIKFDSYMVQEKDLKPGQPRLLTVDNEVVVPVGKKILIQLTGGDVIHSWAMPNFGVKMDAVPGHLNETWFEAKEVGVYYGQCSELCGVNHGFMPIKVHVVTEEEFKEWVEQAKEKFASLEASPKYAAIV